MPNLRRAQIYDITAPILSGATEKTKTLLNTIRNTNRSPILAALRVASHQTDPEDISSMGGGFPACISYDLQEGFSTLVPWILSDTAKGCFISLHDHMPNPVTWSGWGTYSQQSGSNPTSNGVYDLSQGAAVFTAILGGGAQRARWLAYLDTLCAFFNGLVDASGTKIPVLFRPLHEQLGTWFWWHGYSAKSQLVSLWQDYVDRLRYNGVTNVLMVWNTTVNSSGGTQYSYSDYQSLYPGDTYVDIIGVDIYSNAVGGSLRHGWIKSGWAANVQLAGERNKPLTIPEMGFQNSAQSWSATSENFWVDIILPYIKVNLYQARMIMFWCPPFSPTTPSSQNYSGAVTFLKDSMWTKL